jgi:hypothetical protein
MNKLVNKALKKNETFLNFGRTSLVLWVFSCIALTVTDGIIINEKSLRLQAGIFKDECASVNGKERYESTYLSVDVYCITKSGNESIFLHQRPNINFAASAIDRISFGVFNLKATFGLD